MAEPGKRKTRPKIEESNLPIVFGSVPLGPLVEQHGAVLSDIKDYDPLKLAACFGGLLTDPSLQANCLRLEVLTHLSLALAKGTKEPTAKIVSALFSSLGGGPAGWMEDPAEDVFVSNISTPRGNFRILEGIWEAAGFHTQRAINALEMAPMGNPYDDMRASIYSLLKLSDEVCERARLKRNIVGQSEPQNTLPKAARDNLSVKRRTIRFTDEQLQALNLELDDLAPFGFDASRRSQLTEGFIGHSELERYPLVYGNGEVHVLLPTAVSAAIRRFIVEKMEIFGLGKAFPQALAFEYGKLIANTSLLGQRAQADLEFKETMNGLYSGISMSVDEGFLAIMHLS